MGSPTNKTHKQRTIEKIRVGVILDRLMKHFMGEIEMSATQVSTGLALLKKVLPDLKQSDQTVTHNFHSPQEMTDEQILAELRRLAPGDGSKGKGTTTTH